MKIEELIDKLENYLERSLCSFEIIVQKKGNESVSLNNRKS